MKIKYIFLLLCLLLFSCGVNDSSSSTLAYPGPVDPYPSPINPTNLLIEPTSIISSFKEPYRAHSLVHATSMEIAQAALDYTNASYIVIDASPVVVFNKQINASKITALQIPCPAYTPQDEPPLALVIIKGTFDGNSFGRPSESMTIPNIHYIGYVINLNTGSPSAIIPSINGGRFKMALNDPNIPDDPTSPIVSKP